MNLDAGCLIDTNILLRLSRETDPQYGAIQGAMEELDRQNAPLYFSLQNIAEFWNVCTRPFDRNGYGLSIREAALRVAAIERNMTLLPDNERVYAHWHRLVKTHDIRGVQVHDARLVALMQVHGVSRMLTLNQRDFARFAGIEAIHPDQIE